MQIGLRGQRSGLELRFQQIVHTFALPVSSSLFGNG